MSGPLRVLSVAEFDQRKAAIVGLCRRASSVLMVAAAVPREDGDLEMTFAGVLLDWGEGQRLTLAVVEALRRQADALEASVREVLQQDNEEGGS